MRFSEILFVHERHGRVEQSATSAAPAHAVVDDEPAKMGDTRPQVFPIDGKRSDNPPIPIARTSLPTAITRSPLRI
jgi:hypothetical protein